MSNFQENLASGRRWEEKVSRWLQADGYRVLTIYEYTGANGRKAPRMMANPDENSLILPDLQVAARGATHWIEVKSKSSFGVPFADHPSYKTTGIDLRHWEHYRQVQKVSGLMVVIFFVHHHVREIRCASLDELDENRSKYINFGNGMIYWGYESLGHVATIDDQENIQALPR